MVVTNYHMIQHARIIIAAGEHRAGLANVVAIDRRNDIALLHLDHQADLVAQFRADLDIELGEEIIVGSFPLQGLLGTSPQISGGNISALTGMHGDSITLTFNAPIGSGSSGGLSLIQAVWSSGWCALYFVLISATTRLFRM